MAAPLTRVALNLVYLVPGEVGGMEVYARELIPRLAAREDLDLVCLVNREAAAVGGGPWGEVCPQQVVPVHARNRLEWVRGEQQHVPRMAAAAGADLVHSLASTAPLWGQVPRITTIHDLNYLMVPEAHFGARALGMRVLVPAAARRSRRIIVDAASTRADLRRHLRVPEAKVDVVPLAATPPAGVRAAGEGDLRARLGLGARPVVLSPGAKRPHKNAAAVLGALARLPAETRPVLVVSGYPTSHEDELRAQAGRLGIGDDVVFTDWLPAADLEGLYALARLVVLPSRYEGFGFPVLEAMQRGVPVVTSARGSLPEVAGDAALLVDPDDVTGLAGAIDRALRDAALRERLIAAGHAQAARFSWERTAELTAASYRRTLGLTP
jgi:glycosyltransferase involved in cell wall biosynthesis